MSEKDRCYSKIEELELVKDNLIKENLELKKTIETLTKENKEQKNLIDGYKVAIARWEAGLLD